VNPIVPRVVDASALAAVVFQEPGFERVAARLAGATVFAPTLLKYELANVAWIKARRHPASAARFFAALALALDDRSDITWQDVNASDVALLAYATGMTAYDASYLWLAGSLGADLITLDQGLVAAAADEVDQAAPVD
jgi:predicted nucleic acid-binding protein